jgi:hypothetical protein
MVLYSAFARLRRGRRMPGLRRAQSSRYHHLRPSGQKPSLRPVHIIDFLSGFEHEQGEPHSGNSAVKNGRPVKNRSGP